MRKRSLFAILGIAALSLLMVLSAGLAFADEAGPEPNGSRGDPAYNTWETDTEIWADLDVTFITYLEPSETFGTIPTGSWFDLLYNKGDLEDPDPNMPSYDREYDDKPYPSLVDDDPEDTPGAIANLSDWGPGVTTPYNSTQTDKIDYIVAGNTSFNTVVFVVADFAEVDGADTIPIYADDRSNLSIEKFAGGAWLDFTGTGFGHYQQVLTAENPVGAGDEGLTFGFNLRLSAPADTLPGLYHTTMTFVTYQS